MQPPKATDEYSHGQMMGMLVIIRMFENAQEEGKRVSPGMLHTIKQIATRDLAQYLDKHEEDVLLLVDEELKKT